MKNTGCITIVVFVVSIVLVGLVLSPLVKVIGFLAYPLIIGGGFLLAKWSEPLWYKVDDELENINSKIKYDDEDENEYQFANKYDNGIDNESDNEIHIKISDLDADIIKFLDDLHNTNTFYDLSDDEITSYSNLYEELNDIEMSKEKFSALNKNEVPTYILDKNFHEFTDDDITHYYYLLNYNKNNDHEFDEID